VRGDIAIQQFQFGVLDWSFGSNWGQTLHMTHQYGQAQQIGDHTAFRVPNLAAAIEHCILELLKAFIKPEIVRELGTKYTHALQARLRRGVAMKLTELVRDVARISHAHIAMSRVTSLRHLSLQNQDRTSELLRASPSVSERL
jgi:hypothetical protein